MVLVVFRAESMVDARISSGVQFTAGVCRDDVMAEQVSTGQPLLVAALCILCACVVFCGACSSANRQGIGNVVCEKCTSIEQRRFVTARALCNSN